MKEKKTGSFKDNLKRMLVRHSFRPALEMEIICFLLVLCFGGFRGIYRNQQANNHICQELDTTVAAYDTLLTDLIKIENITADVFSSTKRAAVMKSLYEATIHAGYTAELYLFDEERHLTMSSREEISEEEQNGISGRWKILEQVRRQPDTLQMVVSRGGDRSLFLGRGIEREGAFQGYAVIQVSGKVYDELLAGYDTSKAVIALEDYWVLETNGYQFVDPLGRLAAKMRDYNGLSIFNHGVYYVIHQMPKCGTLTVYTFFNYTEELQVLFTVFFTGAVVLSFLFFAGLANAEKMAAKATGDISALNNSFLEVERGNLHPVLDIHSSTEFENIGQGFNQMILSLNSQMEKNKELAEAVAYEQVKRLTSQFKSHFLFNTLDNIRFMCKLAPEQAENMVISLSELLRYYTEDSNQKVTIDTDFNYIKLYFEILKVRFGDAFVYQIQIEEDVQECMILKLLVQPILENAVKYGFGKRDCLKILVTAKRQGNDVCIVCRDNGDGISLERLTKIRENLSREGNTTPHLGLYNVHRRLQLTYGSEYGISLESKDGLQVTVTFPIQ